MFVWVIDTDDDVYWLTAYPFVQSLPVFLGISSCTGLRLDRKAEHIEITEECVCVFEKRALSRY